MVKKTKTGVPASAGPLIVVGGHEDKEGDRTILRELVNRAQGGTLLVMTLASEEAAEQWKEYKRVFTKLGAKKVEHFDMESRGEADVQAKTELLKRSSVFFFTGGDQLKITSKFGGTNYCETLRMRHFAGAAVAGTSAGASVVSETMLVTGPGDNSHRVGDSLRMAPGLGLLQGIIVDQHFAERGRIGRLIGAVSQNPRLLGVGIDEDTAMIVQNNSFSVVGSGAIYVVDGSRMSYTNVSESKPDVTLAAHNLKLDLLSHGDAYDLEKRSAYCAEKGRGAGSGAGDAEA